MTKTELDALTEGTPKFGCTQICVDGKTVNIPFLESDLRAVFDGVLTRHPNKCQIDTDNAPA